VTDSGEQCAHTGDAAGDALAELATRRRSYGVGELAEDRIAPTWLEQLRLWYAEAVADPGIGEPNAMQVATAEADGRPDIRTVLARGFDAEGVVFYTNYDSAKGRQLAANPVAAAVFAWLPLERQVRFRGPVTKVSPDETAAYFASRPRGAQLGAWASPQSQPIQDRAQLTSSLREVTERFGDDAIPPPPFWGGYRITVAEMEFWQGRQFRLHDRLRYRLRCPGTSDGSPDPDVRWLVERLAP